MNELPNCVVFHTEKLPTQGEDAEPILTSDSNSLFLAVLDGLGGAGSTQYEDEQGQTRTGAYIASRLAREVLVEYFRQQRFASLANNGDETIIELSQLLAHRLRERISQLEQSPSKLKSSLIRRLPTTLAALYATAPADDPSSLQCCVVWAGDSRAYSLSPSDGLQQLSVDDLKSSGDALANLRDDSPLSNYVNADVDFELHLHSICLTVPCILLVASDGCFGYMPTPMHFEHALLSTLQASADHSDYQRKLEATVAGVASDDASLALVPIGFSGFDGLKQAFSERAAYVRNQYVDELNSLQQRIELATAELEGLRQKSNQVTRELWLTYRPGYERWLPVGGGAK